MELAEQGDARRAPEFKNFSPVTIGSHKSPATRETNSQPAMARWMVATPQPYSLASSAIVSPAV
jgi:hypothetical protein